MFPPTCFIADPRIYDDAFPRRAYCGRDENAVHVDDFLLPPPTAAETEGAHVDDFLLPPPTAVNTT